MSIHTILSQEMEKFDKKFVWHPSGGGEYWYHTGNPTEAKQWIKSFATRIVEEAQREERERIKKILPVAARINNSGVVTIDYQEWVFFIRKIDSGTKLQKMKEI